jgi:hypothetical protein
MNPKKLIKSRYSLKHVNTNNYGVLSSSTNSNTNSNIIFAPYLMAESITIIDDDYEKRKKQELRKKKIKNIID